MDASGLRGAAGHGLLYSSLSSLKTLRRSIYHLALAEDRTQEAWLTLLDQWMAAAGLDALELVPLFDQEYFPTLQASQHLMRVSQTSGV
ncbi:MAG TPA: hypothetical protein VFV38_44585 [Ktedonobacteraceae bacterium]|nr:hypothetical protein [Ktedonobacteraceae bacterium]